MRKPSALFWNIAPAQLASCRGRAEAGRSWVDESKKAREGLEGFRAVVPRPGPASPAGASVDARGLCALVRSASPLPGDRRADSGDCPGPPARLRGGARSPSHGDAHAPQPRAAQPNPPRPCGAVSGGGGDARSSRKSSFRSRQRNGDAPPPASADAADSAAAGAPPPEAKLVAPTVSRRKLLGLQPLAATTSASRRLQAPPPADRTARAASCRCTDNRDLCRQSSATRREVCRRSARPGR